MLKRKIRESPVTPGWLSKFVENSGFRIERMKYSREGSTELAFEFELMPDDYLRFAEEDVKARNKRGRVNAISNAKRAIDCQVHGLLSIFFEDYSEINKKF